MSATGRNKKDKPRLPMDMYETPDWAVHRLLEVLELGNTTHWLEPCAGAGSIVRAVQHHRPNVQIDAVELRPDCGWPLRQLDCRNVFSGQDFLTWVNPIQYDVVIGNPPYSLAMPFIQRCLTMADKVILLLRINFLASEERAEFLRSRTPDIYVLPNRPSFTGGGTDATEYAWFMWHSYKTEVGVVQVLKPTSLEARRASEQVSYARALQYAPKELFEEAKVDEVTTVGRVTT